MDPSANRQKISPNSDRQDVPSGQDLAFERGEIDIGFTCPPSTDRSSSYELRLLFREPLVAALPKDRK
jgi:DNA-binding transcriptional LysR family regulator